MNIAKAREEMEAREEAKAGPRDEVTNNSSPDPPTLHDAEVPTTPTGKGIPIDDKELLNRLGRLSVQKGDKPTIRSPPATDSSTESPTAPTVPPEKPVPSDRGRMVWEMASDFFEEAEEEMEEVATGEASGEWEVVRKKKKRRKSVSGNARDWKGKKG